MTFRISGKNVDIGEALRGRIDSGVAERVGKYYEGSFTGHATVEPDGFGYRVECALHLDSGISLHATGRAKDAHAAFDQAADHIEQRLRRYKRKLTRRRPAPGQEGGAPALDAAAYVIAAPDEDEELPADYAPLIVAETATKIRTLTVSMAVMELDLTEAPVVVFRNAGSGGINVVYRRPDGNVGWIDPALTPA
ncbi:ribosome hibernation-promoting factor, HPF/YfiA family [Segnochrobactraceae bacterium EtOH-i3]